MRSYLAIAVAVLALLGAVVPAAFAQAPAPKVTVEGFLDQTGVWSRNVSVTDIDVTRSKDSEWYGRTRGRFQITGEVGKAKGVMLFEQDNNWGTQTGTCYTAVATGKSLNIANNTAVEHTDNNAAGRRGHFGTSDGCLNTELVGNVEMLWMYTEFPLSGSGSLLPFIPAPGTLRAGFQPFENDTYKLGVLAFGNYGGLHAEVDVAPGVKVTWTYAQIEEAGIGHLFGNDRGDDFATIFTAELSPFKGLDIKPIYAYVFIDGKANPANPFSYGPRTGKGGVSDTDGGNNIVADTVIPTVNYFPRGSHENRHTLGLDARWKMGPFSIDPTVFYQFGSREMLPSVATGKTRHGCGGNACVEQDMSAWFFDVRGGWQSGPLTLEALFAYATGNSADQDLRSGRTISYYQPIDTNAVYGYQWGAITAISDEYISQLYYGSTGLCFACSISYDKYGAIRLAGRASYAVTPAFKLRGIISGLWTAEEVDTLSVVNGGPRNNGTSTAAGGTGLWATRTGPASQGSDRYVGTEVDLGFDWNFAPNISFLFTYGHLFAGSALDTVGSFGGDNSQCNAVGSCTTGVRGSKDADMLSTVVRYTF
jgi:hypothetical protein